jgi:hypothetical protein
MPQRPCIRCGRLSPLGVDCPRCGPSRQTKGRGSGWDASSFRAAVLARAGGRCEHGRGAGDRCAATEGLEAHHRDDLVAGGSNDPKANGVALCRVHHRALR